MKSIELLFNIGYNNLPSINTTTLCVNIGLYVCLVVICWTQLFIAEITEYNVPKSKAPYYLKTVLLSCIYTYCTATLMFVVTMITDCMIG